MKILTPIKKPKSKICSGKFGDSGKMVIKPFSIPEELRNKYLKVLLRFTKLSICGCWEWQGRIHNGYGSFPAPEGGTKWAHRVSYALFNGDISGQMHIDHKCNNRKCVNPVHLEQKAPIDNYLAIYRRKLRAEKRMQEEAGQLTLWK